MTHGPGIGGWSTVVGIYPNGQVAVPFGSYNGQNSGIPIDGLGTTEFRSYADVLFGFSGTEIQAKTTQGWLTPETLDGLKEFCVKVANAFLTAKAEIESDVEEHEARIRQVLLKAESTNEREREQD
jgi:hypothetical protein